jgi:hypothetical protein
MAETLGLQGFAVDGIGDAIVEQWKVTGLPISYKRRLRVSAKSWLAARGVRLSGSEE